MCTVVAVMDKKRGAGVLCLLYCLAVFNLANYVISMERSDETCC